MEIDIEELKEKQRKLEKEHWGLWCNTDLKKREIADVTAQIDSLIDDIIKTRIVGKYFTSKAIGYFYVREYSGGMPRGIKVSKSGKFPLSMSEAVSPAWLTEEVTKEDFMQAYDDACIIFREKLNNL